MYLNKTVHLVGLFGRLYGNARSTKHKIRPWILYISKQLSTGLSTLFSIMYFPLLLIISLFTSTIKIISLFICPWKKKIPNNLTRGPKTDGQTDTTKLTVAFRNFAKSPKNTEIYFALNESYSRCNCLVSFDRHLVVTLHLFY